MTRQTSPPSVPARIRALPPLMAEAEERCDICGVLFVTAHSHVIDLNTGRRLCTCESCAQLFHRECPCEFPREQPRTGAGNRSR